MNNEKETQKSVDITASGYVSVGGHDAVHGNHSVGGADGELDI